MYVVTENIPVEVGTAFLLMLDSVTKKHHEALLWNCRDKASCAVAWSWPNIYHCTCAPVISLHHDIWCCIKCVGWFVRWLDAWMDACMHLSVDHSISWSIDCLIIDLLTCLLTYLLLQSDTSVHDSNRFSHVTVSIPRWWSTLDLH